MKQINRTNKDYVIHSITDDSLYRFTGTDIIVLYADKQEARNDAILLGAGYFVLKASDALPHHLIEIQNQINKNCNG